MTVMIALTKLAPKRSLAATLRYDAEECPAGHYPDCAKIVQPPLRLCLFGRMSLWANKREIPIKCRKAGALLAYLALAPGMKESRDRLAGLLWSETENSKARASLRQTLHTVRAALQKEGLGGVLLSDVRLNGAEFVTDIDDAIVSIQRGDPVDFLMTETRMTDTLLSEYNDIDPSYESWLRSKRESVRRLLVRHLEDRLSTKPLTISSAKRIACALLQLDPTNETACRRLMQAYMNLGNTGGALAAYGQLWSALEEEFDIEPSAPTQSLAVAIKNGTYSTNDTNVRAAMEH